MLNSLIKSTGTSTLHHFFKVKKQYLKKLVLTKFDTMHTLLYTLNEMSQWTWLKLLAELNIPKYMETIKVSQHNCISTGVETCSAELLCSLPNTFQYQ
jgi:hypothetical protein